jgi:hypothetical protein
VDCEVVTEEYEERDVCAGWRKQCYQFLPRSCRLSNECLDSVGRRTSCRVIGDIYQVDTGRNATMIMSA